MEAQQECCPRFRPEPWDGKELNWENRQFVVGRVRSLFHIPLNFASVMKKNMALIEAAGAKPEEMLVLSDENSLWGADIYISVTKNVPGAKMATISGAFMSKVFEGPYKNMGKWHKEMESYVKAKGKGIAKLYSYYTTCPKCSKKYGENYIVLLAQIRNS
ncbi:MAG: hypothetical protein FJZ95_02900 [Chloroflexi bacterium]|nr:hypothetical protein [Chloroflexota bacterium]